MASEAKLAVKTELDGRVITYIFGDSSRATVDAWVAQFTHYLESTQRIDEMLILLDFTASANAFTPYFSGRALTVIRAYPTQRGKMAFIHAQPYIANVVQFFLKMQRKKFTHQAFTTYESALEWLTE